MSVLLRFSWNSFRCTRFASTLAVQQHKPTNLNRIKLIGSVAEVYNENTRILFNLRTFDENSFYDVHKILVPPNVLEILSDEVIQTNNKLLIVGKLNAKQYARNDGKSYTAHRIVAQQLHIIDTGALDVNDDYSELGTTNKNYQFDIKDENRVQLESFIWSPIEHADKYSAFFLAMRYSSKDSTMNIVDKTDLISIFAYNDVLRNILKRQLNRLDRVRVEGILKYKPCIDSQGKKKYKGYIKAERIIKLITFNDIEKKKAANKL
ncbi:uncharacterized protein LOC116352336 [Contarinia nasturtii]|uniref:uncharacterized protein LOC116352336 n=1 Tax=Contarinia nasturtii TaxID=265458 RepID=UPI0012D45FB1|nr:uncharacterized protein LOC116352336 [Contarinia nasturtii]